jgi:hypothetical protein
MQDGLSHFKLPIIERGLTSAEREVLIRQCDGADAPALRPRVRWSVFWITLAAIAIVVLRLTGVEAIAFVCPGMSLAFLMLGTWAGFLDYHSGRARALRKEAGSALECGRARVVRIASTRAILVKEAEDEGPTILFDIGGARTLVLRGQTWYGALDHDRWTCTVIDVVEVGDPPVFLGPFLYGDRLDTILRLDPCNPKHLDACLWIADWLEPSYATLQDRPFEAIWQQIDQMLA